MSTETKLAKALVNDPNLWRCWWEMHGSQTLRGAALLPLCGAFSDQPEQTRTAMLGRGLGALARRRVVLDLGEGKLGVVQYVPNETDPRMSGFWRLWPVPAADG